MPVIDFLRNIFGLAAQPSQRDEAFYMPSRFAMTVFGRSFGAKFAKQDLNPDQLRAAPGSKILVLGTSKRGLRMKNGRLFDTGHNVSETLLPMLHLHAAGFEFEFATPDGAEMVFEEWSWVGAEAQGYESELRTLHNEIGRRDQWQAPMTTSKAVKRVQDGQYAAVFAPGGHGTMIEMAAPDDDGATRRILETVHAQQIPFITLCHGPNVLRAAPEGTFEGYEICAFPDSADKVSPKVGYLPGQMVEFMEEQLVPLGIRVVNKNADDSTHVDRELITGASPAAANKLGALAVRQLLAG